MVTCLAAFRTMPSPPLMLPTCPPESCLSLSGLKGGGGSVCLARFYQPCLYVCPRRAYILCMYIHTYVRTDMTALRELCSRLETCLPAQGREERICLPSGTTGVARKRGGGASDGDTKATAPRLGWAATLPHALPAAVQSRRPGRGPLGRGDAVVVSGLRSGRQERVSRLHPVERKGGQRV